MKKTLLLLLTLAALSACNTFQGMGRDMEDAGEAISDGAKKVRDSM